MPEPVQPFVGGEALARGVLNRHQLRTRYQAVFPNVYLRRDLRPSLEQRIRAAWLWSDRRGTVAGAAAAALHGAKWIDDQILIELIHSNARPPTGVVTRRDVLIQDEVEVLAGITVTTPERTAFDLGRRGPRRSAVARLDALAQATGLNTHDVRCLAKRHRGTRGLRRLETVLDLVDPGAQSLRESYLRLLLIDAGLPRPQTQIPVTDARGVAVAYLDVGWQEYMVAVEYDGDHHRVDRWQYVKDIRRLEMLERMGWVIVRVVAEDRPAEIVRRTRRALLIRGAECASRDSAVR